MNPNYNMNLRQFQTLDPQLLPGLINTALRNDHESLEDLTKTHGIDLEDLDAKLGEIGYRYVADVNQVRPREPLE